MQENYDVSELPFEQLFMMAEEKFNEINYEQAQEYYALAYKKKPHDDMIVLCYANTLKYNDKPEEARKILMTSIKNNPNGSYKRYFEMAELEAGQQSIKIFQKGISEANKCISNPFLSTVSQPQVKRDIAQAYASIAEVCLTDFSNIPFEQVEHKCLEVLEKGKIIDSTCMDVHLQIANCLFEKSQNQMAKKELIIIKEAIMSEKQEYDDELVTNCAKLFMEIGQYQHSIDIFEKLNESQNNHPQTIYLLAFCAYKLQQYGLCKEYIEQYPQGQLINEEVGQAMNELKIQLCKKIKKDGDETGQGGGQQQQWMDMQDQDEQLN